MTARSKGIVGVAAGTVLLAVLVALYVYYFTIQPSAVQGVKRSDGAAEITLQTVGALGSRYKHPDWVSYLVQDDAGEWVHSTEIELPANTLVRVTILQYDSATGLRNPFFARPQGTIGGTVELDGKAVDVVDPNSPGHTFAVPELGVFVPLPGIAGNAPSPCSAAPCTLEQAHRTVTFSFRTGRPGRYRFQCFVPCAAGYNAGNGGPMQTYGYMTGYLNVV